MSLSRPSEHTRSGFMKVKEHLTDLALLIEPKSIRHKVPQTFNNAPAGEKDEVIADISVFADQRALDSGNPTRVLKGVVIKYPYITEKLEPIIPDGAQVGRVVMTSLKSGNTAANLTDVDDATWAAVSAYYEGREAAVAAALDSAPAFD